MNDRTFRAEHAHKLEDPERQLWLPPGEVISNLHLSPGMTIADVGAGTGYFTLPLAEAVGAGGRIYAVDFQEEMLNRLRTKLHGSAAAEAISLVRGEAAATTLADSSCDLVFMANIWHELDGQPAILGEVKRLLRPGGRLAILDWRPHASPSAGPPSSHRIPKESVNKALTENGWSVGQSGDVGAYHYLLIAAPPAGNAGR